MVRPFHLRDLPLVHRLSEQGVPLHTKSSLINSVQPVRNALIGLVGGELYTYVWKGDNRQLAGFIQLTLEEDSHHGQINYLSTSQKTTELHTTNGNGSNGRSPQTPSETAWLNLLDEAIIVAGRSGLHSLVAELNENSPNLPTLRRAGFAVYTRQDIWMLDTAVLHQQPDLLQKRTSADDWEVQLLYANIVPRMVQLVEPMPPLYHGDGWVLREGDELAAFVHIHDGDVATWMRLFIHPNAEARIDEIVHAALAIIKPTAEHPVFCCVRRYQSWLQNSLLRHGFSLWDNQAVMVKHTVHHVKKSSPELAESLDAKRVTATAPMVQRFEDDRR